MFWAHWENNIEIEVIKCIDCQKNEKIYWDFTENKLENELNIKKWRIKSNDFIKNHKC